jgi:RimJ/RimL family protein N-acetyltransferase
VTFSVVSSSRVLIRSSLVADAPFCFRWFADPIVTRYLPLAGEAQLSFESAQAFLRQPPPGDLPLTIVRMPDSPIGCGGFRNFSDDSAEVSIILGERSAWGQGLAREALGLLIDAARSQLNLAKLWLVVRVDNDRGLRLFRGFGFLDEGEAFGSTTPRGNAVWKQRMLLSLL